MIKYLNGNLFDSKCLILVNPVNTVGVMGKGVALQFKQRYPAMVEAYRKKCFDEFPPFVQGDIFPWCGTDDGHVIVNIATKGHWRYPSQLEWIEEGLNNLRRFMHENGFTSVAMPALGCGCGGLDYHDVYELIDDTFSTRLECREWIVEVYNPRELSS